MIVELTIRSDKHENLARICTDGAIVVPRIGESYAHIRVVSAGGIADHVNEHYRVEAVYHSYTREFHTITVGVIKEDL